MSVNAILTGKQSSIPIDSTPTAGSTNAVSSGGVKTYVDGITSSTEQLASTSANADYRVLLSTSATDNQESGSLNKSSNLKYNPSTNTLTTSKFLATGSQGFTNEVSSTTWAYLRLQSGDTNKWDIATRETDIDGALQFRPLGTSATNRVVISNLGELTASSISINNTQASKKATLQYDQTLEVLNFVFT